MLKPLGGRTDPHPLRVESFGNCCEYCCHRGGHRTAALTQQQGRRDMALRMLPERRRRAFIPGGAAQGFKRMQRSRRDAALRPTQSRRGMALTSGLVAQSSKGSRGGAKGLPRAAVMTILLFIGTCHCILAHRGQIMHRRFGGSYPAHSRRDSCSKGGSAASGNMPRDRGIPRRGGRSGVRVSSDRGSVQPVSPINEAPPSPDTDDSEQECLLPQGTYQSFRFRFPSRLAYPEVVVNFSVFITEEDPSSPPRAHDNDVFIADMTGLVHRTRRDAEVPAPSVLAQPAEPREDSGNDLSIQEILQLPDLNVAEDVPGVPVPPDPEEGMVIWIDSPSYGDSVPADPASQLT